MAEPIEPPDVLGDWAIVAAQLLAQMRLERRDITLVSAALTDRTESSYQVAVCLARVAGQLLRPDGWDGGPIGYDHARKALYGAGAAAADPVDAMTAARMVAYGAAGDAGMVRSLALAVCAADRPVTHLRQVVRCMLEVLAAEPRHEPTPEGTPDDERP